MNYDKKLHNIQSSAGSYINTRYYFSDIFSVLVEVAYLDNIYDVTKTNKGSALISGGMFILSFLKKSPHLNGVMINLFCCYK